MLLDDHHHFFEGSVAGSFTQSINGTLDLAGAVDNACNGVGSGQTQVIVAMAGDHRLVDIRHVVDQVGDLFAILVRQAITGSIRDIDRCSTGSDDGFHYPGQVFIVGPACIFGIELHIICKVAGPFYGLGSALQDLLAG